MWFIGFRGALKSIIKQRFPLQQESANWSSNLFLYKWQAKNTFYTFKGLRKKKNQKKNISWHTKSIWNSNLSIKKQNKNGLFEATPITYILSTAGFLLKWLSWEARETAWPAKPKIFTIWVLTERASPPILYHPKLFNATSGADRWYMRLPDWKILLCE